MITSMIWKWISCISVASKRITRHHHARSLALMTRRKHFTITTNDQKPLSANIRPDLLVLINIIHTITPYIQPPYDLASYLLKPTCKSHVSRISSSPPFFLLAIISDGSSR